MVRKPFLRRLESWFEAPAERVDFGAVTEAVKRINTWTAKRTLGLIEEIVSAQSIRAETRLCLVNALYFKASWNKPFEGRGTLELPFHVAADKSVPAKFMHREFPFGYAEDGDAQVLELPYAGGETSMVVVLPRKRHGLAELENALTAVRLRELLEALSRKVVEVRLPRFRFGWSADLRSALVELGMEDAFDSRSDLSLIARSEPLSIGGVLHKARIEVNEQGTEAAAATAVAAAYGGFGRTQARLVADHPFLFLIRHVRTGTILFLGRVGDPSME